MLKIGPKIIKNLLDGMLTLKEKQLVLQNIQPSTIFISRDGTELTFADISYAKKEGQQQPKVEMLHSPYAYDLVQIHKFSTEANTVKDMYSVGIIILEILVGTDLILAAHCEQQIDFLLQNCSEYLGPSSAALLQHLIFFEHKIDVRYFADHFADGPDSVIGSDMLRVEAALSEDLALQNWQKKANEYIEKNTREAYDRFRFIPGDVKRNLKKADVEFHKFMEDEGIQI